MARITIKQINNSPTTEGGVIVFDGNKNDWSNLNTNSILSPSGTTIQRPTTPVNGHFRYNQDTNQFEFFENSAWRTFSNNTLQQTYDISTTPEITLNSTQGALTILDNATPIGANLFEIQSNDTLTDHFTVSASGSSISGLNYPTVDGLNNHVLTTDGVGNLFFAAAAGGSGETNTVSNVGTGSGIFRDKIGINVNLRSIIGGTNITATQNADDITLNVTGLATVATSGDFNDLINQPAIPSSIDDLTDVDTTTVAPVATDVLAWNGTTWVPTASSGGTSQNLVETFTGDVGSFTATIATDTFNIVGGTSITTDIVGDILIITNDDPNIDQNLWSTVNADTGTTTANAVTDTLTITGGTSITTDIIGDILIITNDDPNIDQNLWSTFNADTGTTTANTVTDILTITGGTSITTGIVGDVLTITNDAPNVDQNIWSIINADTGSTTANLTTDTLTVSGGTNITTAIVGDTLTVNNDIVGITDLSDVDTITVPPTVGQVLEWTGTTWVPAIAGGGSLQNLFETFTADTGTTTADNIADTLIISGGTSITTGIVGDILTITNDAPNVDQNIWSIINADTGTTTADNIADTLIISGGTGISTAIVGDTLTITNTIMALQNKLDGIVAPSATDDSAAGFSEGSFWIDIVADAAYRLVDSTASAAVWIATTLQTTDLATVAVSGDHTDLLNIGTNSHTDIDNHISATNNPHATNLWSTFNADTGTTTANAVTDILTITGGTSITTGIVGDVLIITNDDPNIDQNLWSTVNADTGTTTANIVTDTLTITGGTSITTDIVGDILIITNDAPNADQNLWETFIADTGTTSANLTTDTLTVSGGTNITTAIVGDILTVNNDIVGINDLSDVDTTTVAPVATDVLTFNGTTWLPETVFGTTVGKFIDVKTFLHIGSVKDKFMDVGGNGHSSKDAAPIVLTTGEIVHITISTSILPADTTIIRIILNPIFGGAGQFSGGTQVGASLETTSSSLDDIFLNLTGYPFVKGDRISVFLSAGSSGAGEAADPLIRVYVRYD